MFLTSGCTKIQSDSKMLHGDDVFSFFPRPSTPDLPTCLKVTGLTVEINALDSLNIKNVIQVNETGVQQ